MLSLARARNRRARQLRFQASRSFSVDQSMDCDSKGFPQVTAPKGSFKHLAQSLVRLQTLKSKKTDLNDPSYGASRGSYRKISGECGAKQPWDAGDKIPETLFGYSAKYAIYVQIFIILLLAIIAVVVVIRGPIQSKSLKNSTDSRNGYTSLDFHNAIISDKCTLDRIDINSFSEELFNSTYRLQKPFVLSYKRGAKSWIDAKLWEVKSLKSNYGGLSAQEETWDGNMDETVKIRSTLEHCLEDMKINQEHITGNHVCFLDNSTLFSSDLLTKLRIPPLAHALEGKPVHVAQVSRLGSSLGWDLSITDSWNGLMFGSKRWLLINAKYPLASASFSGDPHNLINWLQETYQSLAEKKFLEECVQMPGDVIYLPEMYYWAEVTVMGSITISVGATNAQTATAQIYQAVTQSENPLKRDLEYLVTHLPGNADVVMKLASALQSEDNNMAAVNVMKQYLSQGFDNIEMVYKMIQLLDKVGKDSEAEDILQSLIKKGNVAPKTYLQYGRFLLGQQRAKESTQILHEAVQRFSLKWYLWDLLIAALRQSGEKTKAKQVERELKKWKNGS